jgi:hypothetical protein
LIEAFLENAIGDVLASDRRAMHNIFNPFINIFILSNQARSRRIRNN